MPLAKLRSMLSFLQISNFAIVESLDLDFRAGFTAITGETGAGKSILVDALGLLKGNRADTKAIRSGADKAELSAEFELDESSRALTWLRHAELDQGNTCLLRRLINENGRSRSWINGTAVTLQQLAELGDLLVEIHGQNEHMRLGQSEEQYRLLDGAGTHDLELNAVLSNHATWSKLEKEKQDLLVESPLDVGDIDLLQYQLRELENKQINAAEFQALETEHRRLAKGSEIMAALQFALSTLESSQSGVGDMIHAINERLIPHQDLDSDISEAVELLDVAAINCEEARSTVEAALSRMDLSPERLLEVERQLEIQHDLARKHRVRPEQLSEVLQSLHDRLNRAGSRDRRLHEIEIELEAALQAYREAAKALHKARILRAGTLSAAVTALLQELDMRGGRFEIEVIHDATATPSIRGSDRLALKVSANPGTEPGPLRKVASGGELSRISLAIKVACKDPDLAHTQVFDEVDAGIGGETANAVGALLHGLSAGGQALCVTHLAQVAVCADQQIQVQKSSDQGLTQVQTSLLDSSRRIDEIARMLGGKLSDQSRAHAKELLATAATRH
jgi:DNA repair protein RecN (Recombination protein N)